MSLPHTDGVPLWQLGASVTASAIRERSISSVDVVRAAVDRMRSQNVHVNAVTVDLGDQALVEAERADQALRTGQPQGPLHGVPVTIKENVDQLGQRTPNGVPGLLHLVATDDAPVVRNLKQAGAIIIGRTNTPEFSLRYFTDNPLRGLTKNPWDPAITSGGSSGGAAVAVALGMGGIAHGNDLIGSLRYPAYCCGVTTIRPSFGRIPAYNPTQQSERTPFIQLMSVQGPIAREVRDLRLGLEVMAQRDPRDPWWVPAPLGAPRSKTPIRVAVAYGFDDQRCEPEIADAIRRAADHLSDAGYAVDEIAPPSLHDANIYRLLFTDIRALMGETIRTLGSPDINAVLESYYQAYGPLDYSEFLQGLAARTKYWRQWILFLEDYPLVLWPVCLRKPFEVNEDLQGPAAVAKILHAQFTMPIANFLGLPAVSVPAGVYSGKPLGVQIVGQRFREDLCLDAAQVIENAAGIPARLLWKTYEHNRTTASNA